MAIVKICCETIGMAQLMKDWGQDIDGRIFADSSAALGIVKRKGNGKMRHVRVGMLWLQHLSEEGDMMFAKVLGTENPADLMTKVLSTAVITKHMRTINQIAYEGKPKEGLDVA